MAWSELQHPPALQPMTDDAPGGAAMLMHVLDQIDYGIALGGADQGWLCNRTARLQLAESDFPLSQHGTAIVARQPDQAAVLIAAVLAAQLQRHRRLLTLRTGSRSLSLAVVPAAQGEAQNPLPVMLLMGRRSVCSRLTAQQFCSMHGLTPAESDVLAGVLTGSAPSTIAQRHGVAVSTVRTQVSAIKAKTGTRRLQDLLVQAALLPPLVPLFEALR